MSFGTAQNSPAIPCNMSFSGQTRKSFKKLNTYNKKTTIQKERDKHQETINEFLEPPIDPQAWI